MTRPAKNALLDAFLELALGLVAGLVFLARLFGGRSLFVGLLLAAALLVARALRNRHGPLQAPGLRPGLWLSRFRGPGLVLAAGFLAAVAMQHAQQPGIGIDGPLLYAQVRSAVIDGDFDLTNEFRDFVPQRFQHWAHEARQWGLRPDPNAEPGPAVLWSPFFVAAHGLVLGARLFGSSLPADGYGAPYFNAVCFASLVWAFVGVCLAYRIGRGLFPPLVAAVTAVGLWFASPLIWYSVYEPAMPHAPTTAVVSAFVLLWLRLERQPESPRRWLATAFVAGLLLSANRYNVYFFVLPALTLLRLARTEALRFDPARLRRGALVGLGLLAAFGAAALPFFLLNLRSREGQVFRQQDLWEFTLRNVASPKLGEILFSSAHGLVSWTPLAGVGLLGLLLVLRRERRLGAASLLTLAAGILLLASSYDWSGGWSFGSRRLTEAFVLFALGLGAVAEALLKAPQVLGVAALGGFVLWNLLLAVALDRGEVPRLGTFAFREAAERAVGRVYETAGHPPAFPASWLFAWRHGVSPERFDRLYGHAPMRELRLDMGTPVAETFLGRGWSHAETADGAAFRWSDGPDSTVLIPLDHPVDRRLRFRGVASRSPSGSPQVISLQVNGGFIGSFTVARETTEREAVVAAHLWRPGLNEIRFIYAWTVEAREVYKTREGRRLAWQADLLDLRPVNP